MGTNMCIKRGTGIPAANYTPAKYCKTPDVYDLVYDLMVRITKIGIETIAEKAHLALPSYLIKEHDDEDGAVYFEKTWSLKAHCKIGRAEGSGDASSELAI
jgi:hypothetical protein